MNPDFTQRFSQLIEETEGSKIKFAKATGKTAAQITDICKGRGKPTFDYLHSLSVKYGINLNWLVNGQGPMQSESAIQYFSPEHQPSGIYPLDGAGERPAFPTAQAFVMVPRYDVRASAGPGAIVQNEAIVDYMAFKRDWVNSDLRSDPLQLAVITAEGDSMEPTIKSGDLLLLDRAQTRVKKDAIYILRLDDALIAKRLQWLYDGCLAIRSDNPVYKEQIVPQEATERVQILGRVIWFGRRM